MLTNFVLLVAVPVAWGYAIKVSGTVELGEDMAQVLNEFREKFLQEENMGEVFGSLAGGKAKGKLNDLIARQKHVNTFGLFEQKDAKDGKSSKTDNKDLSLLDEMVIKNEERAHVYGKHSEKIKKHQNNISA